MIHSAPPAANQSLPAPRVRVGALAQRVLLALVLPVTAALLLDWQAGTRPLFTLAAAVICIPLATVLVSKAALRDMDRIIAIVAPVVEESGDGADKSAPQPDET